MPEMYHKAHTEPAQDHKLAARLVNDASFLDRNWLELYRCITCTKLTRDTQKKDNRYKKTPPTFTGNIFLSLWSLRDVTGENKTM